VWRALLVRYRRLTRSLARTTWNSKDTLFCQQILSAGARIRSIESDTVLHRVGSRRLNRRELIVNLVETLGRRLCAAPLSHEDHILDLFRFLKGADLWQVFRIRHRQPTRQRNHPAEDECVYRRSHVLLRDTDLPSETVAYPRKGQTSNMLVTGVGVTL